MPSPLNVTAPGYSAIAGALTGVVLWVLQAYAFKGSVPAPVQTGCLICIPAALSGLTSLLTRRYTSGAAPVPALVKEQPDVRSAVP